MLISPSALADLLASVAEVVLLDTRPDRGTYLDAHIAGAVYAGLNTELSTASDAGFDASRGGRHPLPPIERWAKTLGGWGIGPQTTVVVYDECDASNAAARAWWMLRAAGHEQVLVLDGGFRDAAAEGVPRRSGEEWCTPRDPYPVGHWMLPTVTMSDVEGMTEDSQWRILDVRSAARYRGETEPIDPVAGHIPGAVNLFYGDNVEEGRYRQPERLRAMYEDLLGDVPPERLVVHCGSGVTACQTLLALELAGLPGASLYVGSWSEWCRNNLPSEP